MMKTIYHADKDKNNFGDAFNVWLATKLTRRPFEWGNNREIIGCGSILGELTEGSFVFGSGYRRITDLPPLFDIPEETIYSVRGLYSMVKLGIKPVHGCFDPVQLLPAFMERQKGKGTGLIRHYNDHDGVDTGIDEISVLDGVDKVLDFINQHESIITSSLHVLIAADALRKKTVLCNFGGFIDTDGFKYHDYFSVAGYPAYNPVKVPIENIGDVIPLLQDRKAVNIIRQGRVDKWMEDLRVKLNTL